MRKVFIITSDYPLIYLSMRDKDVKARVQLYISSHGSNSDIG